MFKSMYAQQRKEARERIAFKGLITPTFIASAKDTFKVKINKDEIMKALRMWNVTGQNASVAEEAEAILKMCDVDGTGSRVLIRVLRQDSAPAHPESHAVSAHATLLSASTPSALRLYPSSRSLLRAFHRGPLRPSALPLPSLCPAPSQATARSRTRSSSTASPTTGT